MDRFIVSANFFALLFKSYLKSSMDRFIEMTEQEYKIIAMI